MLPWMIYGANGYTGRLGAQEAAQRGLAPVLAGRNPEQVNELGNTLGLETRIFDLSDPAVVTDQLQGMALVLNCAGPFSRTSRPLLDGCLRTGAHYLDMTGELAVFEAIFARATEVQQAGIVALPGVGFDIVPTDCLAAMLKRALPDATHLQLATTLDVLSPSVVGPGTLKTAIEGAPQGTRIRRAGAIIPSPTTVKEIPFANGTRLAISFLGPDVSTAYYSTGIPNIEMYMVVNPTITRLMRRDMPAPIRRFISADPVQALLKRVVTRLTNGPSEAQRAEGRVHVWGAVTNPANQSVAMEMTISPVYAFGIDCALASVAGVIDGHLTPGVYTPSLAFGADFVQRLADMTMESPGQWEVRPRGRE